MIIIMVLGMLFVLFWIGFVITGAIIKAAIWVGIQLPVALCIWSIALALCCTIIFIPVGLKLFRVGGRILIPAI